MPRLSAFSRARQTLAGCLGEWELPWLSWPEVYPLTELCGLEAPSGEWLELHRQLLQPDAWAAGITACWRSLAQAQPLVCVLEWPHHRAYLEAFTRLPELPEWLLVLLLDPNQQLAPVPHGGGWFQRQEGPPAYAWPGWLGWLGWEFGGSLDLEQPNDITARLDRVLGSSGRRLLHLYGEAEKGLAAEMLAGPGPRPRLAEPPPDSLEQGMLQLLPGLLGTNASLLWSSSRQPPCPALRCLPQHLAGAAWGLHRGGRFPIIALDAPHLDEALGGLLHGLPPGCLLLLLQGGLCWAPDEAFLDPCRLRDLALLRQIHGLALSCPADLEEARQICELSQLTEVPIAVRLTHAPALQARLTSDPVEAGRSHCLRQGEHVAIFALGSLIYPALLAAEALASWGVHCQVWDVRFLKPLDRSALEQAQVCPHWLTVEEHCLQGGLATTLLETLSSLDIHPKVQHVALPASPPIGRDTPLESFGLDADGIQKAVRQLLGLTQQFT